MSRAIVHTPDPNVAYSLPNLTAHDAHAYNFIAVIYSLSPAWRAGQQPAGFNLRIWGSWGKKRVFFILDIYLTFLDPYAIMFLQVRDCRRAGVGPASLF